MISTMCTAAAAAGARYPSIWIATMPDLDVADAYQRFAFMGLEETK
jgi:hypothetical protein